jgi:hypothetical protein
MDGVAMGGAGVDATARSAALRRPDEARFETALARAQGGYFIATGLWPILHLRSFEAVTGPKLEGWLVKMVGALATSIGATLLAASRRSPIAPESKQLALTSAAAFLAVDVVYVARGRIKPIYLADAVAEVGLLALWGLAWKGRARRAQGVRPEGAGVSPREP